MQRASDVYYGYLISSSPSSYVHLSLLAGSTGKLDVLRCEYLVAPLGIDVPSPRLSWLLPVNVDVQEAYQVIVGTDSVRVAQGMGDR